MIRRVAIYGGTRLGTAVSGFVRHLAVALVEHTDAVLVTGGYDFSDDTPGAKSTDRSVADAVEAFAAERGIPLASRLETWLPEPTKDRIDEKVHRFERGRVVRLDSGARKRRFQIVNDVDALVTIQGEIHTALVLEVALAIGKPALPLPFTGGDSAGFWRENKAYYQTRFDLSGEQVKAWEALELNNPGDELSVDALRIRDEVVRAVSRVLKRSCLVLMPFREKLDQTYGALKRAVADEGFEPIRLDESLYTGDVRVTVRQLLSDAEAIVVDVTDASPNVLYELGYAHASNRNPLLVWRLQPGEQKPEKPFYLQTQRLVYVTNEEDLTRAVHQYFEQVRRGSR